MQDNDTESKPSAAVGSSWWSSLLETAKEKSINAFEMVRHDLTEFTVTVKHDINEVASNDTLFQNIPKKLQNLSKQLSTELQLGTMGSSNKQTHQKAKTIPSRSKEPMITSTKSTYSRLSDELDALKTNESTYLIEPSGDEHKDYADWLEKYDPDNNKGEISNLLIDNVQFRALYSKLVPAVISNKDFWSRYFYKVKQLENEEKKRLDMIERATSKVSNDDDLSWDEDDTETETDGVAITETKRNLPDQTAEIAEPLKDVNNGRIDGSDANRNLNADKKSTSSEEWEKVFEVATPKETLSSEDSKIDKKATVDVKAQQSAVSNEEWESWD